MNPVVHFEMPAGDSDRMADFYTSAFGWQMQRMGPEMGNYIVVTTTELSEEGRPKQPGAINGGFYPRPEGEPSSPSLVIAVDDISASIEKIKAAGGKILGEPAPIPGVGLYVMFVDTEGNRMSVLQPMM